MKTPDRRIFSLAFLMLAASAGVAFAADVQSAIDHARTGAYQQEQIRSDTKALVADLDATIDEYQRNDLNGEELKTLKKVRQIIASASDTDMAKILELLKNAGASSKPEDVLKYISTANIEQKGVLSQLKGILDAEASEEEAQQLADEAGALADRQASNLQTGIGAAQWSLTSNEKKDDAAIAASFETQAAEQKAIAGDLARLQAKIDQFAKNPNNQALADRFKKGLDECVAVSPKIDAASGLLDQKKLFEAITGEKTARDDLRQLARTISPPLDAADALRAASAQLDKMIDQQKSLIAGTVSLKIPTPEEWTASVLKDQRGHEYDEAKKNGMLNQTPAQLSQTDLFKGGYNYAMGWWTRDFPGFESQQGDLVAQSDALSQDIIQIAKPAADALISGIPPMQSTRASFTDRKVPESIQSQNEALGWLQKAKTLLDQQLAETTPDLTGDAVADLTELQKEAQKLAADQTALEQPTGADKTPDQAAALGKQQADLKEQAKKIEQKAEAANAPAAAQSLAKAAANMEQAAAAASDPAQAAQAVAQQQQAAQNLAAAAQLLGQQAAADKQAEQQVAADEKALEDLAKLIEAEQKIRLDTMQVIPQEIKQPEGIRALAPHQQGIQKDTNDFQKTLAAIPPDPAQPVNPDQAKTVDSASHHMGDAAGHLVKAEGTNAEPDEKKAIDDLMTLQTMLQAALQAAQAEVAANDPSAAQQTPDAASQTAQDAATAAAIAQAQAQVAASQSAMAADAPAAGGNDPAPASDPAAAAQAAPLSQTGANVAAAAPGAPDAATQAALQAATNDLTNAAQAAAQGQSAQAQAAATQAQADLAQAAAALAQSQAGIAAGPPGDDSGGPPGADPGAGPGTGPDTGPGTPSVAQGPGSGDGPGAADGGGAAQTALGRAYLSHAKFLGLPPRDRATIQAAQSEKYPQAYAAKVEQYLKNLADESGHH